MAAGAYKKWSVTPEDARLRAGVPREEVRGGQRSGEEDSITLTATIAPEVGTQQLAGTLYTSLMSDSELGTCLQQLVQEVLRRGEGGSSRSESWLGCCEPCWVVIGISVVRPHLGHFWSWRFS